MNDGYDLSKIYSLEDEKIIKEFIKKLIDIKEIKLLNRFLLKNPTANQLKLKDLNKEFKVDGYKFCNSNGRKILQVWRKKSKHEIYDDLLVNIVNENLSNN